MTDDDDPRPERGHLSRRAFLATGAVAALGLAACGDEALRGGADAAPDALDAAEDTAEDTAEDALVAADTAPDTAPDALADTAPDTTPPDTTPDTAEPPPERFAPNAVREEPGAFPYAVQSGDPTPSGVVLQTRYTGDAALTAVVFAPDDASGAGDVAWKGPAPTADGGFVHLELAGALEPDTAYAFAFVLGDARSPVGRFKTAPAANEGDVVVFGASSCARYDLRPFDCLGWAAADELDFFALLGDTTYADDSLTLAAYRERWRENLTQPSYHALFRSTSVVAIWDDHEVENNWDPETFPADRLALARQAFEEHVAVPRDAAHPGRYWRKLSFGRALDVFVIDGRAERRKSTRGTADEQYLGHAQADWLMAELSASPAAFKVILNGVPITNWPPLYLGADDRWEGYAVQRRKILSHVADDGVTGVLWVAGDHHFAAVTHLDPPGGEFAAMNEVLVGPIAHLNPALSIIELTGSPAQFPFLSGSRNYGRFTVDLRGATPTLTVEHVDDRGIVLNTATFTP